MRVVCDQLQFNPKIPSQWTRYRFKINFRGSVLSVVVQQSGTRVTLEEGPDCTIMVDQELVPVSA